MAKELPSEEIQGLLKKVVDHFDKEDRSVRERQIREWRKLKFYWDGFTNIWWSEVAHDWRIFDAQTQLDGYGDQGYYDKQINIFKAYLESIIAALSASIPGVKATPDDADKAIDNLTAKTADKIAQLIGKHNDEALLWLHALYIYCTEGVIAGYVYAHQDEEYGTYQEPNYEDQSVEALVCPSCYKTYEASQFPPAPEVGQEMPYDEIGMQDQLCPECAGPLSATTLVIPRIVGYNDTAKSRVCMEAYGGLFVKIPVYAMNQKDMPYLIYSYETHFSNARERYEHLEEKFAEGKFGPGSGGVYDPYERWGRLSTEYLGEFPVNTVTCRNTWLRPSAFHILKKEDADKLKKAYPKGAYVVLVNDEFAEACEEKLDDKWQIAKNPLADYLHTRPLGVSAVSGQDITNEIISLVLQTIEHGIPQTFADPKVVDFEAYRQNEVAPGQMFPATQQSGKAVSEAFHEVKTATLSQEVLPFGQAIQGLTQVATGALPSLFGGDLQGGGKTASEYSMSKNQAMQRLQTTWKMLTLWWKNMYGLAIPLYMELIQEDERFVTTDKNGNYVNVFIRKAELEGKIGDIELEGAENLPLSWMQKKDTLMQFLQAGNPVVMEALTSPENLPILAETVGLGGLTLPGYEDRQKQLEEITLLLESEPTIDPFAIDPMNSDPAMGMMEPMEVPSILIEPEIDNNIIHIQICRSWAVGEAGRLAKLENPKGYKNVLLHLKMHLEDEQQKMMMQAMMASQGEGEDKGAGSPNPPQNDKVAAPVRNGSSNG